MLRLGDLKLLPQVARSELGILLSTCEDLGTWPWQCLYALVAVPAKSLEAERAISVLPLIPRLWGKARRTPIRAWSAEHAGFWDTAVDRSSALQAAMKRALISECHTCLGVDDAMALMDTQALFDSMVLNK